MVVAVHLRMAVAHGSAARRRGGQPMQCRRRREPIIAQMHVPSDSFGGVSPERKAGEVLRTFFTFCAVKIIMAQMQGPGRGPLGAYNAEGYAKLRAFLEEQPMRNGDDWVARLMETDEMLAVRVMEVRAAYAGGDFEWGNLQRVCASDLRAANVGLMRRHAEARFAPVIRQQLEQQEEGGGGEGEGAEA